MKCVSNIEQNIATTNLLPVLNHSSYIMPKKNSTNGKPTVQNFQPTARTFHRSGLKITNGQRPIYIQYMRIYSRCQTYESSPIFVKNRGKIISRIFEYSYMLISRPQTIYISYTQACTLCFTIASSIFALIFLPRLLATIIKLIWSCTYMNIKETKDFNQVTGQMATRSDLWVIVDYCVLKIGIIDCYGNKHKMLDGNILRNHGSGSNWPWYRVIIFISIFNKVGYVCLTKNIEFLRKHKYHKILQRRTTLSFRKSLCRRWFTNTFLTCVFKEDTKTKII